MGFATWPSLPSARNDAPQRIIVCCL
jgi:hypothetical protein